MKFIRILVLIVVALASGSVFAFAFAAACAMVAICLIALLTAYAINPEDVKVVLKALTSKLDTWFTEFFKLMRTFTDVVRDAAQTAKAAAGIQTPEFKAQEGAPEEVKEVTPEPEVVPEAPKKKTQAAKPRKKGAKR